MTSEQPLAFLPTGSATLNSLLAMELSDPEKGGIPIRDDLVPIALITGTAGTGKTVLALQIANAIAQAGKHVYLYCLEQDVVSIKSAARSFGFECVETLKDLEEDLKKDPEKPQKPSKNAQRLEGQVVMPHLSPLPIHEDAAEDPLDHRLLQLEHAINRSRKDHPSEVAFVLDSLDGLVTRRLQRSEVYRLFQLFRTSRVPLIVTAEMNDDSASSCQSARFLADVVIDLHKDSSKGYLQLYLEIAKSRLGRQAFGRHLYKIRTKPRQLGGRSDGAQAGSAEGSGVGNAVDPTEDSRPGIVVYKSIHAVLSHAIGGRDGDDANSNVTAEYELTKDGGQEDIYRFMQKKVVSGGACFAVVGPPGTHKLALALNLATGRVTGQSAGNPHGRLLMLSFGGTGQIGLDGVAWFKERADRSEWHSPVPRTHADRIRGSKWWTTDYKGPVPTTVLTFQIGELTPEECFHAIEREIKAQQGPSQQYSAVLLSDTAELCTGFPLLSEDRVFLPALLGLFGAKGLVSVCIGVEHGSDRMREMEVALLARADYRIQLHQYPDMLELLHDITEGRDKSGIAGKPLEQAVSLVIDNVVGKHYDRQPHWLWVETEEAGEKKTLHCGTWEEYQTQR
jgi:KaiC/GvpD/RAD55 family RecA-like ATPase